MKTDLNKADHNFKETSIIVASTAMRFAKLIIKQQHVGQYRFSDLTTEGILIERKSASSSCYDAIKIFAPKKASDSKLLNIFNSLIRFIFSVGRQC